MTDERIRQMITALQDTAVDLTEWEEEFLLSVVRQHKEGRTLSEKQCERIEHIYNAKTPTGSPFGESRTTSRVRNKGR